MRLLASVAGDFRGAHGHTGTVHPQVHGGSHCAHPLHTTAFVGGDCGAQGFGGSFHLLDTDFHSRQFVRQGAAFRKACRGAAVSSASKSRSGRTDGLRALRFPERFRLGGSFGSPFFSLF